ncbi:epoxide hydrolase N-terminal domain-containing protein [Phytohabitans suffuscus]|uniref:epoxide hydrolase N-terminal domain-containing protein n=1 Tax=Phytohabitans suffuscus TaxID=624315 RepID=UPI001564CABF
MVIALLYARGEVRDRRRRSRPQRDINRFAHFRTTLDDTQVHFVHARAAGGGGIPLVLTNGWPSTFAELLPLVPLLTDPAATRRSSPPGGRRSGTASPTPPPAWPPGSWRSGAPGPTRTAPSTVTCCSPRSPSTASPARSPPRCATTTTTAGFASRSARTPSWTCRPASPSSTTTSPTRATCPASGWSASSPSAAGPPCPEAGPQSRIVV